MKSLFSLCTLFIFISCSTKPHSKGYDAELTQYQYPYPVHFFHPVMQGQKLKMAYMDVKPEKEESKVIVLLHGKNFGGYAFKDVAQRLRDLGYRVVMPDQVGFGKSSKPHTFQFSFQALGEATFELMDKLKIHEFILMGHSMGGMLATRMALMHPGRISQLILVNPIGLEDWKLLTSYKSVDELYANELKTTPEKIKDYQKNAYYSGLWKDEYDWTIEPASRQTEHPDFSKVAWNSALTYDMLFTQPVVYEFPALKVPTSLIIGQKDKTAPGKAWAPEENKKKMGNYPVLGNRARKSIPHSRLIPLEGLGHSPFIEDLDRFFDEGLLKILSSRKK